MKTKSLFLKAIPLVMLVLLLVSACKEFTGPYEVIVQSDQSPKLPVPYVTISAVTGGVLLSWPEVDAVVSGYEVRRNDGTSYVDLSARVNQNENGVYQVLDIVDDDTTAQSLPLKPNTDYTYTVIALPDNANNTADPGVWIDYITTGEFPARTERPKAPAAVALELNPENKTAKVTITPPENALLPNYYSVSLNLTDANNTLVASEDLYTTTEWTFTNLTLSEDVYKVSVTSEFDGYYSSSAACTASAKAEWLFNPAGNITVAYDKYMYNASNSLVSWSARINLNNLSKPGVTYTIERATIDKSGNISAYTAPQTLYRYNPASTVAAVPGDAISNGFTADLLGGVHATLYDRLPVSPDTYLYRVTGAKGGTERYIESSLTFTVDPSLAIQLTITVNTTDSETFSIVPNVMYKGALQSTDKLVIYYATYNELTGSATGNYNTTREYTVTEIDSQAQKTFNLLAADTNDAASLTAYIVRADGTRKSTGISFTGTGLGNYLGGNTTPLNY